MKFLQKIILIVILLSLSVINIIAEEEKSEPIEFEFEFKNLFGNNSNIDAAIDGITFEDTIAGSMTIPFGIYSLSLGFEDVFTLGWADIADGIPDQLFNEFEIGLGNTFSINEIMDIGINYIQKINYTGEYNEDTSMFNGGLELGFAPEISFAGEYNFGLTWEITDTLALNIDPALTAYTGLINELYMLLSFEFFHFFAPEEITGTIFAENDTLEISYNADNELTIANELSIGFETDIYGAAPYLKLYMEPGYEASTISVPLGFGVGLSYSKNIISIGVDYIGTSDAASSDTNWSNLIETWFTLSL